MTCIFVCIQVSTSMSILRRIEFWLLKCSFLSLHLQCVEPQWFVSNKENIEVQTTMKFKVINQETHMLWYLEQRKTVLIYLEVSRRIRIQFALISVVNIVSVLPEQRKKFYLFLSC
jgi:hypothetical protein